MVSLLSTSLVLLGALILLGSLVTVKRIIERLPCGRSRSSWLAMTALIAFFVLGYLGYIALFWDKHLNLPDLIVPAVFFFGACFVWLSSVLALQTAMDIARITALEQETFTDPLTGLYNRRYMDQHLLEEVAKARRYGFEFAIMLLDLDHFKQINDAYGHQVGDQVLIEVGEIFNLELRDSDILARYGGEEFLVLAPNTNSTDALMLAERLRERLQSYTFCPVTKATRVFEIGLTVSIGVANFGGIIGNQESLVRLADTNLYRAKDAGRNRVVGDGPDNP